MVKLRRVWNCLAKNWEPIVAVLALAVGGWSLWIGHETIQIAERTYELQRKETSFSRSPLIIIESSTESKSLELTNYGVSPAIVTRFTLNFGDRVLSFSMDDAGATREKMDQALEFIGRALEERYGEEMRKKGYYPFFLGAPMGPIPASHSIKFVSFPNFADKDKRELAHLFFDMEIILCYTNLTGTFVGWAQWPENKRDESDSCKISPHSMIKIY